jgi:hypothetical protein
MHEPLAITVKPGFASAFGMKTRTAPFLAGRETSAKFCLKLISMKKAAPGAAFLSL